MIESNDVCMIQGNTGCGKTTQVPQMILDAHFSKNKYCNIICVQPRKVAAISIADFVSRERKWSLHDGTYCGYHIGLDRATIKKYTRITYATTGILVQKLINNDVHKYTHIIVDEIHERDLDIDLVLMLLKVLKLDQKFKAKIVLMSATCNAELFRDYFRMKTIDDRMAAEVPISTCVDSPFEVQKYYLDDMDEYLCESEPLSAAVNFDRDQPYFQECLCELLIRLLKSFDKYELIDQLSINDRDYNKHLSELKRGSVLIFVPGMHEIRFIEQFLKTNMSDWSLQIIPLHSEISIDQQCKVFKTMGLGERKIILSTTIAESSITVPDIKYVIDFCLTKALRCDELSYYTSLGTEWATKSNLNQRSGRAGRVAKGKCFRLITKAFSKRLDEFQEAEVKRVPLDSFILQLKRFDFGVDGEPHEFIAMALEHPRRADIMLAVLNLKMAGALTAYKNGLLNPNDGTLTQCGRLMCALPIDIRLAKLVFLGHVFGKLRETLILAAALSIKSIFLHHHRADLEAYNAKLLFAQGSFCDYTAIINAYNHWRRFMETAQRTRHEEKFWANENMLEHRRLHEVHELKRKLEVRLKEFEINCCTDKSENEQIELSLKNIRTESDTVRENLILKIVIAGAFYPNFFTVPSVDLQQVERELSNKDYKYNVIVKGFRPQHGILYNSKTSKLFRDATRHNVTLSYDMNKCFVQFRQSENTYNTRIHPGVYQAVAMRKISVPLYVPEIDGNPDHYIKIIENERLCVSRNYEHGYTKRITVHNDTEHHISVSALFRHAKTFNVRIVRSFECGYFLALIDEQHYTDQLRRIQARLNDDLTAGLERIISSDLLVGKLVCVPYMDLNDFSFRLYRAKVSKKNPNSIEVNFHLGCPISPIRVFIYLLRH
jgi:ATP-dependent RNA helicase TDRD9